MAYSWMRNKLKDALPTSFTTGHLTTSFLSGRRYFEHLLSFASSHDGDVEAAPETELQRPASMPAPGGDVEASIYNGVVPRGSQSDVPAAAAESGGDIETGGMTVPERQSNVPAAAARDGRRTIAELAIPAVLSLGVYSSIPGDVQLHRGGGGGGGGVRFLYYTLLTFIALAVGSSLCIIFYALTRFDGGGRQGEVVESAKRRWMRISIVFFLLAFMLRIFLLL